MCLLLGTVASNGGGDQAVARNVIQDRTVVAALILVLLTRWPLLDSLAILFVLSISTFQLEYLFRDKSAMSVCSFKNNKINSL